MKMTIHRALSELKLIDSKIEKQIAEIVPTGIYQKGKLINNHIPQDDFEKAATSKYQSVLDLIERKTAIKAAIVKSNSETVVQIVGATMSVADAITMKGNIEFKKKLALRLKGALTQSVAVLNKNAELVEANCQKLLEFTFGKENTKVTKDDMDNVRKPYMENNQFFLCDPLDAAKTAEKIESEVNEFAMEVDAVLSESNATTFIDV